MKHTPGPWKLDREAVYGFDIRSVEENKWLGCTYKDRTHPSFVQDAEAEANALLIAAAPELLEALKALVIGKVLVHPDAVHPSGMFCRACGANSGQYLHGQDCPIPAAEAAIAKAEGK